MVNREGLKNPDPREKFTRFLAWLKKRGGITYLSKCEKKASQLDINNIEEKIKEIPNNKIMLGIIPKGEKKKGVNIVDKGWADGWAKYYEVEFPHHRHVTKL